VEILTTLEYWTASDNRQLIAPWHALSSLHLPLFMADGHPASASGLPVMNNQWTGFAFLITTTCFSVFDGSEPSLKMEVGRAYRANFGSKNDDTYIMSKCSRTTNKI